MSTLRSWYSDAGFLVCFDRAYTQTSEETSGVSRQNESIMRQATPTGRVDFEADLILRLKSWLSYCPYDYPKRRGETERFSLVGGKYAGPRLE